MPADAAGILFTANPLTGARDQVVINAAWGLGEAIVGGRVRWLAQPYQIGWIAGISSASFRFRMRSAGWRSRP